MYREMIFSDGVLRYLRIEIALSTRLKLKECIKGPEN